MKVFLIFIFLMMMFSVSYAGGWDHYNIYADDDSLDVFDDQPRVFTYTPSKLLKKGEVEMQLFNNLYTQTAYRDENRQKVEEGQRSTYFNAMYYILVGISPNSRINIGADVNLRSVHIAPHPGSSVFDVFGFENHSGARVALTNIGPKIKWNPFRTKPSFSVQSAFWFPVAKNLEGIYEGTEDDRPWIDYQMYTWWNQFFFDKTFGTSYQLFVEADLLFRFKTPESNFTNHLSTPLSVYFNVFPFRKTVFYVYTQYAPILQLEEQLDEYGGYDRWDVTSDYAQAGLGAKYQFTKGLNIEISYSNFFTSMNGGAGSTFNLGIRYISDK